MMDENSLVPSLGPAGIMAKNRLFLAFRDPGPSWVPGVPTREQPLWDEHAAFMDDLFARGHIVLAGPYADLSRALVILNAGDAAEASALLRGDPWEKAGILVDGQIIEWVLFLDSRKALSSSEPREGTRAQYW
jgi:uncharacterized protein YciI